MLELPPPGDTVTVFESVSLWVPFVTVTRMPPSIVSSVLLKKVWEQSGPEQFFGDQPQYRLGLFRESGQAGWYSQS